MTEFTCPNCGQTESFTAYEMVVTGPIWVDEDGYEPDYGNGLNYEIPDHAQVWCDKCFHHDTAEEFRGNA